MRIRFPYYFRFVWRQLEFAFFGALTPVGALFIFGKEMRAVKKKFLALDVQIIFLNEQDVIRTSNEIPEDDGKNDGQWM